MKTTYKLYIVESDGAQILGVTGDAPDIMRHSGQYDLDDDEIGKALAHLQLGLCDKYVSAHICDKVQNFGLVVDHDNRAHDLMTALGGLNDTSLTDIKNRGLRAAAIAAGNADGEPARSHALLAHNFFLAL